MRDGVCEPRRRRLPEGLVSPADALEEFSRVPPSNNVQSSLSLSISCVLDRFVGLLLFDLPAANSTHSLRLNIFS